jgi:hypoxanthine phosphoribosyltransferase
MVGRVAMPISKRPEKYEAPDWDYIHELCILVAEQIERSKFKPDLIVALSRGGWIPGRLISDFLENPEIATIKVEHYVDFYKTLKKPAITQPLPIDVRGKRILLVDDIVDTGASMKVAVEYLKERGADEVRTCALYRKPWSVTTPDFFARETDAWVCFPHETYESIGKICSKLKRQGWGKEEIVKRLLELGIKPHHVEKYLSKGRRRKKE